MGVGEVTGMVVAVLMSREMVGDRDDELRFVVAGARRGNCFGGGGCGGGPRRGRQSPLLYTN